MSATQVLFPHDDGRLCVAEVLDPVRDRSDARCAVRGRHYVGPGEQYQRVLPAANCRAVDDPAGRLDRSGA